MGMSINTNRGAETAAVAAQRAAAMMPDGGSMITLTYYGA